MKVMIFTNVNGNGYTLYKEAKDRDESFAITKELKKRADKKGFNYTRSYCIDNGFNYEIAFYGKGHKVLVAIVGEHENFMNAFLSNHSIH